MKHLNFLLKAITICLLLITINSVEAQNRREIGNMILEDVPETPKEITSRIQQYQSTRSASFADWLPNDGGMLISTRFGNTSQLHTITSPGAARNQISFFDEPVSNGSFCPSSDYDGFLFTKDTGGNEFSQIYWYDMNTRTSEMLSDGESVNFGMTWSNIGDKFAFTSSRRNSKDFDIYVSDMKSPKTAVIKVDRGGGYWVATDWSPDDSKLLVLQYLSSTKSNSYILDLITKELTQINNDKTEAVFLVSGWNKKGDKIYATTNLGTEFNTLVQYDVKTKKIEYITEDIAWDVEEGAMNKSRTKSAFTVNENGFSQLYLMDLASNEYEKVSNLPIGQINSFKFHPSREELAMVLNTTETPGDVYSLDLITRKTKRWTTSEVGGLNTSLFPKPEFINYETYDEVNGKKKTYTCVYI